MMKQYAECEVFFADDHTEKFRTEINGCTETDSGLCAKVRQVKSEGVELVSLCLRFNEDSGSEGRPLRAQMPIMMKFPLNKSPEALTAMYMLNPWWTRPAFLNGYDEIPQKTRIVFAKFSGCFACLFPMVSNHFVTMLSKGSETEICLEMNAGTEIPCDFDETVFLCGEGDSVEEAVRKVFAYLEKEKGLAPRTERKLPEMLTYLGWCSWDAFYREVNEEGIRAKAKEFQEKSVPVRWMLVDDGWQQVTDRTMDAFEPDPAKFPHGFRQMTEDIRRDSMVKWFGVWHALPGYWDGITPQSNAFKAAENDLLITPAGFVLPDPDNAEGFYGRWYEQLKADGIDFTKVDGQSSLSDLYKNTVPVPEAARGVSAGLEKASSVFGSALINCMGMAMENILARPSLAVSRNSDDFVPSRENGFAEHLLQNAYNSLYHNELYCCDWDMFWTRHPDAKRHALIRAISGGPVYFSDRVGDTDPEILKSLCCPDGELLMMSRSAKPSADCIFSDPVKSGVLKLQNAGRYAGSMAGGIAVFNLTDEKQEFSLSAQEIPELAGKGEYILFDYFRKEVIETDQGGIFRSAIDPQGCAFYTVLPEGEITCLGLTDKYAGFIAVEEQFTTGRRTDFVLHSCGSTGFISRKEVISVTANNKDVTDLLERNGCVYTLTLPEKNGKTILSVTV